MSRRPDPAPLLAAMRPKGGNAVMASRQVEQPNAFDYFPTPPWAGRAGGELLRRLAPAAKSLDEVACGEGHMAFGLADEFDVRCGDIHDHGVVAPFADTFVCWDFLDPAWPGREADLIATNPPFVEAEAFVRAAYDRAQMGVAVLLRSVFIESSGRHTLFTRDCPLSLKANFCERVPMLAGHWDPEASSATAYSWFFFLKPEAEADSPFADAIAATRAQGCWPETLIPPGSKARLQRHADIVKFAPSSCRFLLATAARLEAEAQDASVNAPTPAEANGLLKRAVEARASAARIERLAATTNLFPNQAEELIR